MKEPLPRLDTSPEIKSRILPLCRLSTGEIWEDSVRGHRVGVLDATIEKDIARITQEEPVQLVVNDPPYNVAFGRKRSDNLVQRGLSEYLDFSKRWIQTVVHALATDSHLYIWLGADVKNGFQPLPDLMMLMREFPELTPRNFITLRNQRGYGTQKNWMWVRQELLHYVKGNPRFEVLYTDIPKVLKGYYKNIGGHRTENIERSKSATIRPGNVWIDIQQVFYLLPENVPGAYAQKPLKAIERIIKSSAPENGIVFDTFAHSGTTLIAGEMLGRRVFTFDKDPIFAELTIRRLEHYRATGKPGWQCDNPFPEIEK